MSAVSSVLSEDHFLCSICLDVFTDPVSTPCGHNYCQKCISKQWDVVVPCECPYCKKTFCIRPELQVNTLISEMVSLFRRSVQQRAGSSSSEQQAAKPGGVSCDVCTGRKLKALKSCPVCPSSSCETHLTASRLKRHQLIDPVENLQRRMCPNHDEQPELCCKADHVTSDVPVEEKCNGKTAEVEKDEDELQQMLQERRRKIEEFKCFLKFSRENADREETENFHDFEKLKEAVERKHAEVTKLIEAKHRAAEKQAEDFIRELEEEISELKRRRSEDLHVLQTGPSMMRDWTAVRVRPPIHGRDLRAQIAQLAETLKKELKRLLTKAELKMVQQFAVDVTLDPETANPCLVLSADGKRVHHADDRKNLPDNPQRFTSRPHVLAKQSVSSGRFYFEVQVKGKSDWILGVTKETIDRKGLVTVSPENGLWTLRLRNEHEYCVPTDPPVRLLMKSKPGRVGVFVDYEEGLISFYDVDAAALMYSFTGCSFTEKLLPFFSPGFNQAGKNSAPLSLSRQPN